MPELNVAISRAEATAQTILDRGLWPVVLYAPGETRPDGEPATGKEPVGPAWGKNRPRSSDLRRIFREHPGRGVGIKLGPSSGVIDIEVDGPRGEESYARLVGGLPETISWESRKGWHRLFAWDDRLDAVGRATVKLDAFPDLEIRLGGRDKQTQSACPPTTTVGEDGEAFTRRWGRCGTIATLPECALRAILDGNPRPQPVAAHGTNGRVPAAGPREAYARKAFDAEVDRVARAPEKTRNDTLNEAAFNLGTLVGAGVLDRAEVEAGLEAAAGQAKLGDGETRRTIRSGLDAGIAHPRDLSDVGQLSHGAYDVKDVGRTGVKTPISCAEWPKPPGEAAFAGLAGEVVDLIDPATEADRAGLLLQFLAGFGSILGRSAWAEADGARHHGNIFGLTIGATSRSRKGTAWKRVRPFLEAADPGWAAHRIGGGLSTGEGLIDQVRDDVLGPDGEVEEAGVADKRLLVVEGEFGRVLRALRRDNNTLSPILRLAYDGDTLRISVRYSPIISTGHHISIAGHITVDELLMHLDAVEIFNGLGNRFLFACVKRSKVLARGGSIDADAVRRLGEAVALKAAAARGVGFFDRTAAFWDRWDQGGVYARLTEDRCGLWGTITARAEANVLRLALLYAGLAGARRIDVSHLESALAFWKFCDDSAGFIFGKMTNDPVANKILTALRASDEGLGRDAIYRDVLQKNTPKPRIETALDLLARLEWAHPAVTKTDGRPEERWWLGPPPPPPLSPHSPS